MAIKQLDEDTAKQLQELQVLEQNMQQILIQKQAFQIEINETENALEELKKSSDEVYKIVGQVMVRSKKADLDKDLKQRQEIIDLRLKNLEKQEQFLKEHLQKKRDDIMSKINAG